MGGIYGEICTKKGIYQRKWRLCGIILHGVLPLQGIRPDLYGQAGQRYDAHHLIESSFGGSNAWWNLHPAAFPSEHQAGIHATNSFANLMF